MSFRHYFCCLFLFVIEELDFREKGGYHRHLISVRLLKPTPLHAEQEWATALVYTGSIDNPNFSIQNNSCVAGVLASAIGQSGENAEYFLNLTAYIRSHNLTEVYLWELEREMLLRMCSWRAKWYMRKLGLPAASWDEVVNSSFELQSVRLIGWGSNEYQQLEESKSVKDPATSGLNAGGDDLICLAKELESIINTCDDHERQNNRFCSFPSKVVSGGSMSGLLTEDGSLYVWGGAFNLHEVSRVFATLNACSAGGSGEDCSTARTTTNSTADSIQHVNILKNVSNVAIGHEALLVSFDGGRVVCMGKNTHGECWPRGTTGLKTEFSAQFLEFSPTLGIQCLPISVDNNCDDPPQNKKNSSDEIVYLASGVRQSVAVSRDGRFYSWGDDKYLLPDSHKWHPPAPSKEASTKPTNVLDPVGGKKYSTESLSQVDGYYPQIQHHLNVPIRILNAACGAKHTVLVDSIGRIWSFGDNSYGQLGRDLPTSDVELSKRRCKIDLTPREVKVDRVTFPSSELSGLNYSVCRWLKVKFV